MRVDKHVIGFKLLAFLSFSLILELFNGFYELKVLVQANFQKLSIDDFTFQFTQIIPCFILLLLNFFIEILKFCLAIVYLTRIDTTRSVYAEVMCTRQSVIIVEIIRESTINRFNK